MVDLLEMPSPMYRRENKEVCWNINSQQRRVSLLGSPGNPNGCSVSSRLEGKTFHSSNGHVLPCLTAHEELRKEVRVYCPAGSQ